MKRLFIVPLLLVAFAGCKPVDVFKNVSTELIYRDETFYHNGEVVAWLEGIELSYDNGKITHEVTFVLTDAGENEHAIEILKIMHEKEPRWDIEVELKR